MAVTDQHQGMLAENIAIPGHEGEYVHAYFARPMGTGPFPGMVLFHHRPGWSDWYKETARLFAYHGYVAICPDLYCRWGHGEPDDVAARVQANGGVADEQVIGEGRGALEFLKAAPISRGKVGFMGTCSGGRHLPGRVPPRGRGRGRGLLGGRVVMEQGELTEQMPVAPIDYTKDLACPVLGIFGEEDNNPALSRWRSTRHS